MKTSANEQRQTTANKARRERIIVKKLSRHFIPNLGTLIILGLFLFAQAVGAFPLKGVKTQGTTLPALINYQGRLNDAGGNPVPDGSYTMTFRLYSQATGGTPLWTEVRDVSVSNGLFNVMLGEVISLPSPFPSDSLYLGVKVDADAEMTPREPLGSVPFALVANVPDGSITTEKIADGAVTSVKLAGHGPGMIQSWEDRGAKPFDATGSAADRILFDTGIDVTVASGKTEYYLVIYQGYFSYSYADHTGTQTGFYGNWSARLVDGETELGATLIVQTGYRARWDAVGNGYWDTPFMAVWLVQLDGGVHSLDIAISGYSDNTMDRGAVGGQKLTAIPLP